MLSAHRACSALRASSRHTARSIATLSEALLVGDAAAPALIAPQQGLLWTYGDLRRRTNALAHGLREHGHSASDVIVSDLPNVAENLLLQLAAAQLGASVATAKDAAALGKLAAALADASGGRVSGAVAASGDSWLATAPLPLSAVLGEPAEEAAALPTLASLIDMGFAEGADAAYMYASAAPLAPTAPLGYFGGTSALTHGEAMACGADARARLGIAPADRVCVSITLCHAFGIGSAVGAALGAGAAVVLPAVGGIRGCGVPSQRAAVTREVLASEGCTLLFADSHTLGATPAAGSAEAAALPPLPSLRGGVVKIGSGADFLEGVFEAPIGGAPRALEYGGVALVAMGKKAA